MFPEVSDIVLHRDTGKGEIMFRYAPDRTRTRKSRDLLSPGIIMRS